MNMMNMNMMNMNMMNMNMMNNQNAINPNLNNFNQNMNYNNLNQINQDVEDVLPYIKEPKKILRFSTIKSVSDVNYINVKVPNSITKSDLYSIAKKYQTDYYSDIILSHNNFLLKNDNSSIESIPENSIINIIEDVDYPDESYYNNLLKKNEKEKKIQIGFIIPSGKYRYLLFPENITISEMIKAALSKLSLNSKSVHIIDLNPNDNSKINKLIYNQSFHIIQRNFLNYHWIFGKIVIATIKSKDKKVLDLHIGILNSTLQLINSIECNLNRKIKNVFINNVLIEREKEKSLASIGINENTMHSTSKRLIQRFLIEYPPL